MISGSVKMEEVDAIIIHTLRSIGCDIEDDVYSILQFSTELIVEATARCLKVINNDLEISYRLPPGMSAKFRVGTSLANAVMNLGYRGEVGYQTFLYSNDTEIRRVLMFLVEKLPKATESVEEAVGSSALLQRAIAGEILKRLNYSWTPPYCKKQGICWRGKPPKWHREGCSNVHHFHACPLVIPQGIGDLTRTIPRELKTYYMTELPLVSSQPTHHYDVAPSILEANQLKYTVQVEWENEWNSAGLTSRLSPEEYKQKKREEIQKSISEKLQQSVKQSEAEAAAVHDLQSLIGSMSEKAGVAAKIKGSRFTHTEKLQFAQDDVEAAAQLGMVEGSRIDTEEELQEKREQEIQMLRDELVALSSKLEKLQVDIKQKMASAQHMDENILLIKSKNQEKEEAFKVKKRTMDLLPDAKNNIDKLQALVDTSAQRLVNLANQWEKHRAPLIEQYRLLKETTQDRAIEMQKKLEEIKLLRQKMKDVAGEAKGKEEIYKQLVSEYERMTKDVNRSAYTRKILEVVANIKKQKEQIDKILIDTKAIQKEINQLSGKLDRTFTVTDELIFKDAKKDEGVRKAYKFLAALHDNFNQVINTVEDTGIIMREIRELEDQIENESKKKVLANLEKITSDYQEMKKENQAMMAKIKKQ